MEAKEYRTAMSEIKELFKTHKLKNKRKTMVGFGNVFWRIIRDTENDTYSYLFRDIPSWEYRVLHKDKEKFKLLTPQCLTIFSIIFNLFWIPFIMITILPYMYFEGAKNFITDSFWSNNVRFFNWVNILLVLLFAVLLILK